MLQWGIIQAAGACCTGAYSYGFNSISSFFQPQHIVVVQELNTAFGAAPGQRLGKHTGVAAFVAGGESAAHDLLGKLAQGGFDLEQLGSGYHLARHAVFAHQRGGVASGVERFLFGVVVRNAALQPVVVNAGAAHHVFQGGVAVGAQGDELLHIALEGGVVALRQKLQAPAPLLPAFTKWQARPEQQRRVVAEHPFQRLERRVAVGPGFAVTDGNLRGIVKAGFQRGIKLPVHHRDFVPALQQMPGGADADNARAQNYNFHDDPL